LRVNASCHTPSRITNRKIRETFTLRRATRFGGFNALSDFVRASGIDRALVDAFGADKAPWATYLLPETLRHLLDGYLLGVERIWHFAEFEQEPLLCVKRDRDRLPDFTLLYRELARFDSAAMLGRLRAIGEELVRRAVATQTWYTLDCDSTVETVYGSQEGARLDPNAHKRGRLSYHPLLCRERKSGLVIHSRLRPGDTNTASGAVGFLIHSVARLPRQRRRTMLLRADRGFDISALYTECERRGWHYVVKLRVMADVATRIWAHATTGHWRRISEDSDSPVEVSELRLSRQCWDRARRVVLLRRRDPANPQGLLWDAAGYNYAAYVTDLDWAPADVAAFYDKRADMEKAIHELKEDFGIDRIASSQFSANAADLELKILAFNLLVLYQRHALGWAIRRRAETLRRQVIAVAGQLIRTAGQWVLKLAADGTASTSLRRVRMHLATLGP
jgi:Transposase DDE domain group 1